MKGDIFYNCTKYLCMLLKHTYQVHVSMQWLSNPIVHHDTNIEKFLAEIPLLGHPMYLILQLLEFDNFNFQKKLRLSVNNAHCTHVH